MTQIEKIQDKIESEIKSAYNWKNSSRFIPGQKEYHEFKGKEEALQHFQQWIKDNIKEG